jgi:glucose/arabinose dehydrogenase
VVFVGPDALVGEILTGDVYRVPRTGGAVRVGHVPGVTKLMSMALSPSFATDRRIYAYVTTPSDTRVVSMTWDGSTLGASVPVFAGIPVGTDHQGGALAFARTGCCTPPPASPGER